jgi:hypothetical protein
MKWGIERSRLMTQMSELPVCGKRIHAQYDRYLRMKYKFDWNWGRNPASRRSFHASPPALSALQRRLVEDLLASGVAICHVDELFEDQAMWQRISKHIEDFSASEQVQTLVKKRRQEFEEKKKDVGAGHYIITYYDQSQKPMIDGSNPLLNFGLHPRLLDVVNSYLGLWSKLIYFDMWHTLPLNTETRISSQRWHRDPEDHRKIRTFLYFNQVDTDNGAMEYLVGSHVGGPYEHVFPWADPLDYPYPPDGEVELQIPASQRVILKGPPGTLIFCDTAGFHRGGTAKTRPRILATSAYVTPASLHSRRYQIDSTVRDAPWSPEARFALN